MTPPVLDAGVIRQKLDAIERSLDTLESLGAVSADRLHDDPVIAAAVERMLTRVVDLAVEINSHVVAALSGRGPGEYAESFRMAAKIDLIEADLGEALIGSVGMRNVIVHQYVDLDLEIIADTIPAALDGYRRYVAGVARFVVEQDGRGAR